MWFRNLLVYRITKPLAIALDDLEAALAAKPARPCASQELSTYGFVAPLGKGPDAPLVHLSHGFALIATRKEERIMPGSVIKDALKEKIDAIEAEQLRKVYKKERDQLKDEIIQAFLPRAFIRKSQTFAALDIERGLIMVDAYSPKKAEDLLSTLREAIGSLPIRPLTVKIAPTATMTDWVKTQKAAEGFYPLDRATLCDTHEDGGKIAATRQDLAGDEIQLHLSSGKLVTNLALAWEDKLAFDLDDQMRIRRLVFEDLLQDQAERDGGDDALGQQDASFVMMMLTFRHFLPALFEALGGEETPQGLDAPTEEPSRNPFRAADKPVDGIDVTRLMPSLAGSGITATLITPHSAPDDDADPLYQKAVDAVRKANRASISYVQRALVIGYNRAARMIERMELDGIVTPMNSNGAREVVAAA